jgi:hypothetical protein
MNNIITISREYGSAGRIIGKKLAKELNLAYYDNEIIDQIALELGFNIDVVRNAIDKSSSHLMYTSFTTVNTLPLYDQIYVTQSKVIRHIASKSSCVIVNGISDDVLEDYENVLKIFIHAPIKSRIKRVKEEYKEVCEDYEKYVKAKDKRRARYYNYYTTKKWGQLKNFDLTINSDLGVDEVVKTIVDIYNNMQD